MNSASPTAPECRVIVVEDEILIAENLSQTLRELGYSVQGCFHRFADAQVAIETIDFDVALLDINLGSSKAGETGIALAAEIRQKTSKPFVFLTAYADAGTVHQATALRPGSYLVKPVNPASLFAAIETALEHGRAELTGRSAAAETRDTFLVKLGAKTHRLCWQDVSSLEAGKNYVRIQTVTSVTEYPIRGTLVSVMEQMMPPHVQKRFLRVSRAVCLNIQHITGFKADLIYCGNRVFENTRIPVRELMQLLAKD